jgi:glycosyltransferase involved in cell wall biosynthesis
VTRLLFIVSEDWYFASHRLHLAKAAQAAGYSVAVLCHTGEARARIEEAGIPVLPWCLERGSLNPWKEVRALFALFAALRAFKPDVIHAVAFKPSFYAALAAQFAGKPRRERDVFTWNHIPLLSFPFRMLFCEKPVSTFSQHALVYAFGGLGFIFSSNAVKARVLRPLVLALCRWMFGLPSSRLILQNPDDCAVMVKARAVNPGHIRLIRGAGVDVARFAPHPEPSGIPLVILPARLLWNKGAGAFVEAARRLRAQGVAARFALVGGADAHNPDCIPQAQCDAWVAEGVIEVWGNREDMPDVLRQAAIICLPSSYGEGLPKSLLEAASCARPIITYDMPGCREVVKDGENGLLVPFRDVERLAQALATLLGDAALRARMGAKGRQMVLDCFSEEQIARETMQVWQEVLKR